MIVAASSILWGRFVSPYLADRARNPIPSRLVSLGNADSVKGNEGAKVAVIEYSDFECPFCGTFSRSVLPLIEAKYIATGKVRFAFRHLPLTNIHSNAETSALAAACAAIGGRFWLMHNSLFADQTHLSLGDVSARAALLGLGSKDLARCMSAEGATRVSADRNEAKEFQINSTPTFLVGSMTTDGRVRVTHRLAGSQQDGQLLRLIEELLR
jgi:protein-disulfide isomerase